MEHEKKLLRTLLGAIAMVPWALSGGESRADDLPPPSDPLIDIQIVGDSIFEWNAETSQSVADYLAHFVGANVTDNATSGAQMFADDPDAADIGLDIIAQFDAGDWDWIVMNGGANDLEDDCGCEACDATLDDLITPDAKAGRIPEFVNGLIEQDVRVIFVGYFQVGIEETTSADCVDEFDALDNRVGRFAADLDGAYFMPSIGLLSVGDLDRDGIHPNSVGSEILAMAIAQMIQSAD